MGMKLNCIDPRLSIKLIGLGENGYAVAERFFNLNVKYVDIVGYNDNWDITDLAVNCERSDIAFVVHDNSSNIATEIETVVNSKKDVLKVFIQLGNEIESLESQKDFIHHIIYVSKGQENELILALRNIINNIQVSIGFRYICIDLHDLKVFFNSVKRSKLFFARSEEENSHIITANIVINKIIQSNIIFSGYYLIVSTGDGSDSFAIIDDIVNIIRPFDDIPLLFSENFGDESLAENETQIALIAGFGAECPLFQ